MDTFELFTHAGLPKKNASVYAALLEHGTMSLTQLSKETHINRPALYDLLPRLQKEGLVSSVQKQKRIFYKAESPKKVLAKYSKEHKAVIGRLENFVKEYEEVSGDRPVIKYFEGTKGAHFVFDDIAHTLPKGGTYYRYSSKVGSSQKGIKKTHYYKTRDTKQIERMVITSEKKAKSQSASLSRHVKSIPKTFDLFEDNISLVIYGDKTAYIDYESKTSFIIESPKITQFQEKLFKLLWKKL